MVVCLRLFATFELPHFNFSLYDARVLATLGKIIVVTFNYRIGVLGKNELLIMPSEMDVAPFDAFSGIGIGIYLRLHPHLRLRLSPRAPLELKILLSPGWLNTNPSPNTKGHVANYGLIDQVFTFMKSESCLLYTSDAADE